MLKHFLFCVVATAALSAQSQTSSVYALVNIDTVTYHGSTDTLDYMPVTINTNGNVAIAGNQKVSATQYNAMMAVQTANAVGVWTSSYNTSNQKAFVTSSATDSAGNLYTAGAIRTASSNGLDFLLTKYDVDGNFQWAYTYDGPGNGNDVATSLCLDPGSEDIYLTGVSDGTFPCLGDYATIKVSKSNGTQVWVARYNHSNSYDVPVKVVYDEDVHELIVSGSSGNSFSDYSIATLKYDPNTGAQIGSPYRTPTNGSGQDKPFGLITDSQGDVYYAGTTYNGSRYNALVTKLDTGLATVWMDTLNLNGYDNAALGLALDDSLNLYVVGTSYYNASHKELFLAKYKPNGSRAWLQHRKADPNSLSDAEGIRVHVKNNNEIFVGGNFTVNGNQNIALLRFDQYGRQTMERTYDNVLNSKDQFMDFAIDNTHIFVSARSFNGAEDDNVLITFRYRDVPVIPLTDSTTSNYFVKDEVISRFHKSTLKMGAINNKDLLFGTLGDFVQDSTCNKIQILLDPTRAFGLIAKDIPVRKMGSAFTEHDTLSLSRLGDYVPIPPFYASLVLTLPSNINNTTAALNLQQIKPDVAWSQLNNIYTPDWVPNDTLYTNKQTSLHTHTLYPNAHINVEKAWDYTTGEPFVRVGVFDSGIETYSNLDLAGITEQYNFFGPVTTNAPDYTSHGTKVAGIIGAKTNNVNGISGIAAGGNNGPGAQVVVMKVASDIHYTDDKIRNAYTIGATGTNILAGKALHIMNSSFGKKNEARSYELIEAVEYANQNGVAFVASRGNYSAFTPSIPINSDNQPATLRPRITMNVGASGTDGNNHVEGANGSDFTTFRGNNIDFMAPGAKENVYTTYNFHMGEPGPPLPVPQAPTVAANSYTNFSGTSSAAPHVSGVVALMMSYRNSPGANWDNLVHEDCEAILKRTATDATDPSYFQSVGYDTISGYGKINADSALSCLQPQYKIRHIDLNHHSSSSITSTNVIASNVVRYWPGSPLYAPGNYSVDVVEYEVTYYYNFSTETFVDAWPLHKASNGHPNAAPPGSEMGDEKYYCEIISANLTSATLKTYAYRFNFQASPPYSNLGGMLSPNVNTLKAAFTLYSIGDPSDEVGIAEKNAEVSYFNVYPNPSTGNFILGFSSRKDVKGHLKVINITGITVHEDPEVPVKNGINRVNLTVNNLPKGVYFINLDIENNKTLVKKIIIH